MKRSLIVVAIASLLATLAYSVFVIFAARNSASELAAGQPYCIQVATRNGYRELSSIAQLSGLRMRGRSAMNHAVLVTGDLREPRLFHWSYRANAFLEGAYGPPPIYCRPRHDYLESLDRSRERSDAIFIAYEGRQFLIPSAYEPKLTWPRMHLLLTAKAPTFEPTHGRLLDGNLATMVSIYFDSTSMLESWRYRTNEDHVIESLGSVHGLTKERVVRTDGREPHLQYYQLRPDGTVQTLITCVSERPEFQCEQLFESNGMMFFFHQMPVDIPRWEETQKTLLALFDSFAIESWTK